MIRTEADLLSCGFDFSSTVRQIASRFPIELDWGVAGSQMLPFRMSSRFAGLGELWKIPVIQEIDLDLPPLFYKHEFHPTGDVRVNHERGE